MIFLGTPQLCGGVDILFFFKVSFEKHPNKHPKENESLGLPGNEILEKVKLFYRQKGGGSFSI